MENLCICCKRLSMSEVWYLIGPQARQGFCYQCNISGCNGDSDCRVSTAFWEGQQFANLVRDTWKVAGSIESAWLKDQALRSVPILQDVNARV